MRVLYVFRSLAMWGGIERILVEKMNHLVTMYGAEVYMLTTDQGKHPVPYQTVEGVHIEDLCIRLHQQYQYHGLRRLWVNWQLQRRFVRKLKQRLAEIQPDVIIAVASAYVDIVAKVKGNVPLIVESHSICRRTLHSTRALHLYYDWSLRRSLRKAQAIVALTEGDAREWRELYGERVKVIPNMVKLSPKEYGNTGGRRVIFVGRFDYQKQVLECIRIWQLAFPGHEDWQLHIYGHGEEQQQVEQAAREAEANITVHPPTADIFDRYKESSILVSTSLFEPFGLVIPEAMSCGLPVVAYDSPYGPGSIITDGKDGFLVKLGDRQCFAQQLSRLMDDAQLRQDMGREAMHSVQRYAAEHIMPQWKELIMSITNKE